MNRLSLSMIILIMVTLLGCDQKPQKSKASLNAANPDERLNAIDDIGEKYKN